MKCSMSVSDGWVDVGKEGINAFEGEGEGEEVKGREGKNINKRRGMQQN